MLRSTLLALLLLSAPAPWLMSQPALADGSDASPDRLLWALVNLADPEARSARADALASREGVSLGQWLTAARRLGRGLRAPVEAGSRVHRVALRVMGDDVPTSIAVHVPASYAHGTPAPLMLALHGTGGNGEGARRRWLPVAEQLGMLVVAPTVVGPNVGYTFGDRERAGGLAALRWAMLRYDVDPDRVFVAGVSRGGHMSWDLALRHPCRFAAIAPMVGGPRLRPAEGHNNMRLLENVAHLPIRDLQGLKDDPKLVANLRLAFARLEAYGARDARLLTFPERGHSFDFGAVDWRAFLGAARRSPWPERVVCRGFAPGQRAFWVELTRLDAQVRAALRVGIPTARFQSMSDAERRAYVATEVDARTARLELRRDADGTLVATGDRVRAFRLLFDEPSLMGRRHVTVRWRGRRRRLKVTPDARVLLRDVAERLDTTALPVAAVEVR